MRTLLHLDASAHRTEESITRRLSGEFAERWRARSGDAGYRHRDLVAAPVPPLDTAICALGRRLEHQGVVGTRAVTHHVETDAEAREWATTRRLIDEVVGADTVLIGAPLYNFGFSAALKGWIDRIAFPGAFVDPDTGGSLLAATRVVIVTAAGGAYGPGSPREGWDFQTPYLRAFLGHHGVPDEHVHVVAVEMTMATLAPHLAGHRARAAASLAAARSRLVALQDTASSRARPRA